MVQSHTNTIPGLAKGFKEAGRYVSKERVAHFLDEHLRARIGTRLLAEQHIALHLASLPPASSTSPLPYHFDLSSRIGIIDTALSPTSVLNRCANFVGDLCELRYGVRPTIRIDGATDATIAQVESHVEYVVTEVLKNAFRAVVERGGQDSSEVEITVAVEGFGPRTEETDTAAIMDHGTAAPTASAAGLTLRFRDRGGGIDPEYLPHIWDYSFTSVRDTHSASPAYNANYNHDSNINNYNNNYTNDALTTLSSSGSGIGIGVGIEGAAGAVDGSSLAGLGYGLPLGRAYAEYFEGGVEVVSLWGWGTDVYVRLRGLCGV